MKENIEINKATSIVNYTLNKFAPTILVSILLFSSFGFVTFKPYLIISLMIFSQFFHYKVGYSVAICKERNLFGNE